MPAATVPAAPAPALDETDPGVSELPSRTPPVAVGARSGEPLFSPEEAARFRAAAADLAPVRPGAPPGSPLDRPLGPLDRAPLIATPGPGAGGPAGPGPDGPAGAPRDADQQRLPGPPSRRGGAAHAARARSRGAAGPGLAIAAFGKVFSLSGVLASCLGLTAVPLLVLGLYGLVTGAAFGADQLGFRTWARPPLAYLLVSLVLLVAVRAGRPLTGGRRTAFCRAVPPECQGLSGQRRTAHPPRADAVGGVRTLVHWRPPRVVDLARPSPVTVLRSARRAAASLVPIVPCRRPDHTAGDRAPGRRADRPAVTTRDSKE